MKDVPSLRAIAQSVGKSERHVSQVIRIAFLTSDLVEALLQGRRPAPLTVRDGMKELHRQVAWSTRCYPNSERYRFGLVADEVFRWCPNQQPHSKWLMKVPRC